MGSYRIARRIGAPPEHVFQAFTDPTFVVDWMDAAAVLDPTGPLDEPGARYTLVIAGPHRFDTEVVRVEPHTLHETVGRGRLGSAYRMVATLAARDGWTDLDLLTEYTMPLGAFGRWIDRRWIDREPRTMANREVDRLVTIVSDPAAVPQPKGASRVPARAA
ncbi:MAG: SRPBCC domain-containing protein [Chloroflexi bacterium]|nr:SRPBCC domain-containing protein [Chloroflexota bacterium]